MARPRAARDRAGGSAGGPPPVGQRLSSARPPTPLPPAGPAVALTSTATALVAALAAAAAGARSPWLAAQPPHLLAAALAAALALALLAAKVGRVGPLFPAKAWILDHAAWRPPADWFLSGEDWITAVRKSGEQQRDGVLSGVPCLPGRSKKRGKSGAGWGPFVRP